jgi:sec-independent protein translocase protein TatC
MSFFNDRDESEDLFRDTRMSFGDHIEDLRWHLIRAIAGGLIVLIGVFVLDTIGWMTNTPIGAGKPLMEFISHPVEIELYHFYNQRIERVTKARQQKSIPVESWPEITLVIPPGPLRDGLHLPPPAEGVPDEPLTLRAKINPEEVADKTATASIELLRPPLLSTLSVTEAFMVYIQVSLVLGIVVGSPWIFWQLWSFVAAGLYPTEKRWVYLYGPFSLALFIAGVILCEWIVIPAAVHYLLGFNEWMGLQPDLRLSEWLSFALWTPVVFGVAFQTPLVMLFLHKLGIVDVAVFVSHWRIAMFALALVACLLAASPDAFSMLALYIPLAGLYWLGILLCRLSPQTVFDDVPDQDEMVEV